jgi:hypothetical protein
MLANPDGSGGLGESTLREAIKGPLAEWKAMTRDEQIRWADKNPDLLEAAARIDKKAGN